MKLKRPLVVLDLETTGTWVEKDKIIEIGLIRCEPTGVEETYEQRINPGIPIPAQVSEVTGIRDEDVADQPFFRDVAGEVIRRLEGADLAGFNLERFDLPVLRRELRDAGWKWDWHHRNVYDAQKIYHLHERRDLTAAYRFYCHKDLEGAHSALADSRATLEVLRQQLKRYGSQGEELEELKGFDYALGDEFYDSQRRFRWWNGDLYMMFGKYAGKATLKDIAEKDPRYCEWILTQNFSPEVKSLVENALAGRFPKPGTRVRDKAGSKI